MSFVKQIDLKNFMCVSLAQYFLCKEPVSVYVCG